MDISDRVSADPRGPLSELCLILVGSISCGKTLTADTLLGQSSNLGALSRVSQIRRGVSEGRKLRVVETPRWYWRGEEVEATIQVETRRSLSLCAPGPFVFLILIPVGEFTEVERRIPDQLERMFGPSVLGHTLVLLTCGEYLMGRSLEQYLRKEEGLQEVVRRCQGRCHVISNRRAEDRQQVSTLLDKVDEMIRRSGGYDLPRDEETQRTEMKFNAAKDLKEKADQQKHTSDEWDDGQVKENRRVNGLQSEPHSPPPTFKLSREGAILSQMMEEEPDGQRRQSFVNTIHHSIKKVCSEDEALEGDIVGQMMQEQEGQHSQNFSNTFQHSIKKVYIEGEAQEGDIVGQKMKETEGQRSQSFSNTVQHSIKKVYSEGEAQEGDIVGQKMKETEGQRSQSFSNTIQHSIQKVYREGEVVDGAIVGQMMKEPDGQRSQSFSNTVHHSKKKVCSEGEAVSPGSPSSSIDSLDVSSFSELRLVLLGRSGSGKSAAGNLILGREAFGSRLLESAQRSVKARAVLENTRVLVVDTPDWFQPERSSEEMRGQISSCMAMVAPGPHAFLLCIPVERAAHPELLALKTLEGMFGADAIRRHTLVLFTRSDLLPDGAASVDQVEEFITSCRPEMLELVERCGDRYHVLRCDNAGVKELLEKVRQTVKESGGAFYSNPLLQQGPAKDRQWLRDKLLDTVREAEDEQDTGVGLDSAAPAPAAPRTAGETMSVTDSWRPKLLAVGALVGAALGVFMAGVAGGAVGAALGTLIMEAGRQRYNKQKTL